MFSIVPCQWIWLVFIPIDLLTSFYANWTNVTGKTYWRSWPPFSSNQWLQDIRICVSLFNCDFKNIYPGISLKNSFEFLPLSSLPRKISYMKKVLRQKRMTNMPLSLQVFCTHAAAHSWLRQSRCMWPATIRRYGLQPSVWVQIIPTDDGDQNFGGLLSLRYLCSRLRQYHSSSYHKDNTFIAEEVRIVCFCK